MHYAILIIVALAALYGGIALGLVILGKRDDESMARALDEHVENKIKSKEKTQ